MKTSIDSTNSTCNIGEERGGGQTTHPRHLHVTHKSQTYWIITSALGNMSVWYIEKYHWIYEKKSIYKVYYFFTIPFQTSQKGTAEILQRSFATSSLASRDAGRVPLPRGAAPPVRHIRDSRGFPLFLPQQMQWSTLSRNGYSWRSLQLCRKMYIANGTVIHQFVTGKWNMDSQTL